MIKMGHRIGTFNTSGWNWIHRIQWRYRIWRSVAQQNKLNKLWVTWSCPWCCADGGQWWGPCSGKTLCGWCSGSGCLSPGRQLLWPHPGLISVTSSTGRGPDTQAASVRHWESRDMLRKSGTHAEMKLIFYRGTSAAQAPSIAITQVCVGCNFARKQAGKIITINAGMGNHYYGCDCPYQNGLYSK